MPDQPMTLKRARELDAVARARYQPTPRAAMAVLLRDRARALQELERRRDHVYDELRELALRANFTRGGYNYTDRGLPERHRDRFSLNDLVAETGKHRTTIVHWLEELIYGKPGKPETARPELIPVYKLGQDQDQDAVGGAAG